MCWRAEDNSYQVPIVVPISNEVPIVDRQRLGKTGPMPGVHAALVSCGRILLFNRPPDDARLLQPFPDSRGVEITGAFLLRDNRFRSGGARDLRFSLQYRGPQGSS